MTNFHIDATNLHWLEGLDERQDHCLHGHGVAVIGERTLEYDCTVSSTALYLLKSLTEDHIIYEAANQMLPCCGHFMFPDSSGENVHISGCPNGIDWTVRHIAGAVELILEDGYTVTVPMADYRRDSRKNKYNPFLAMGTGPDLEKWESWLVLEMARCTEYFEKLPLVQDKPLLDSILYSGVWMEFERLRPRKGRGGEEET